MSGYKHLYLKLFNAITDIIETLKKIQAEAEEEYIKLCEKDFQPILRDILPHI